MLKKTLLIIGLILIGLIILYRYDPAINRQIAFEEYSVNYDWRIFNNLYCNSKTYGHCLTNDVNKTNAEIELYQTLVNNYNGQEKIKNKLIEAVEQSDRLKNYYHRLPNSESINIDVIIKHEKEIFRKIMLK